MHVAENRDIYRTYQLLNSFLLKAYVSRYICNITLSCTFFAYRNSQPRLLCKPFLYIVEATLFVCYNEHYISFTWNEIFYLADQL